MKHNYSIGNIFDEPFEAVWNSERAMKSRFSVTNGNFEYCMTTCKWLVETKWNKHRDSGAYNPIRDAEDGDRKKSWEECRLSAYPKNITLTCDKSCNLSCPTCRNSVYGMDKKEADELYDNLEKNVLPLLPYCEVLAGLGSGELFASRAISRLYKQISAEKYPRLKLYIITNMQLLTEEKWREFANLHDVPIRLSVSIDAAKKETYEQNRRGASYEVLCKNLEYFRTWRRQENNKIEFLGFNFVVQKNNYREMEDFVRFAEEMEADTVEFQRLQNWGSVSQEEYADRNVFNPDNLLYKEACAELKRIIQSAHKVEIIQNIMR